MDTTTVKELEKRNKVISNVFIKSEVMCPKIEKRNIFLCKMHFRRIAIPHIFYSGFKCLQYN